MFTGLTSAVMLFWNGCVESQETAALGLLLFFPCECSSLPGCITLCKVILEKLFFLLW